METEIREFPGRKWGWSGLRGGIAVLFGVVAIASPGTSCVQMR